MNLLEACRDKHLFRPYLQIDGLPDPVGPWSRWLDCLGVLYGIKPESPSDALIQALGGNVSGRPGVGYNSALFLTGRRSGKSKVAALIAAYEAALSRNEQKLSPGEQGVVAVVAPTRRQAQIVKSYCHACFQMTNLLRNEIYREDSSGFVLKNGVKIEILTGDPKSIRGFTLLCAVIDETCFFGLDAESKVRSDTELIRAIRPSLASTGGRLIAISSPYAKHSWAYRVWKRDFGNPAAQTLVVNCPSRVLNPTLPQNVVDDAMRDDLAAAKSEYLGEFRDDVSAFLPRELIESLVIKNRKELLPKRLDNQYQAFVDISGGRNDDSVLAIGHREGAKVIVDKICCWRPPHNPAKVIASMTRELTNFGIDRVIGDNFAAEFCAGAFRDHGVGYTRADKPRSQLYAELLPMLCSGDVELLDNDRLIDQFAGLERRTRSGGRDQIDHAPGAHDDLANAVAGLLVYLRKNMRRKGAM